MGYILDLRKKIGHDPIIMVGAGVLIINKDNEILLQRRTDNGHWENPGGSMELGESFEECAIREVREETGLLCHELEMIEIASGKEGHYIYPNGDEVFNVTATFICKKYSGELKVDLNESFEQRFFNFKDLPTNISPIRRRLIKKIGGLIE